MLIGYGRVDTAEEDPADQVEALTRAGVATRDIHIDTVGGARAARPELELVLARARGGDILVVTRLERLAGSVSQLVSLGARLCERGVGLRVLAQDIDTATAQGRAKLEMLWMLAELRRELRVSAIRDGLAAARVRGRKGGRPPKLTAEQARRAQRLYDEGEYTVARIAQLLGVNRATLYGHLDKATVGHRPRASKTRPRPSAPDAPNADAPPAAHTEPAEPADPAAAGGGVAVLTPRAAHPTRSPQPSPRPTQAPQPGRLPSRRTRRSAGSRARLPMRCPSCGNEPTAARERVRHRQDLAMTWLYPDPHHPGRVLQRRHCAACQPHQQVASIECALCADGPMLAGELAQSNADADPVRAWLTTHGWQNRPRLGLVCARHPVSLAAVEGAGSASSDSDDHDRQFEAGEVG